MAVITHRQAIVVTSSARALAKASAHRDREHPNRGREASRTRSEQHAQHTTEGKLSDQKAGELEARKRAATKATSEEQVADMGKQEQQRPQHSEHSGRTT